MQSPGTDLDSLSNLEQRLEFETLLARLSTHIVNLSRDQVDLAIEEAPSVLCGALDFDHSAAGKSPRDAEYDVANAS